MRSLLLVFLAGCSGVDGIDAARQAGGDEGPPMYSSDTCPFIAQGVRECAEDTGVPAPGGGGSGPAGICTLAFVGGSFVSNDDFAGVEVRGGRWWRFIRFHSPRNAQGPIGLATRCALSTSFAGLKEGFVSTARYRVAYNFGSDPPQLDLPTAGNTICPLTGVGGSFSLHTCSSATASPGVPAAGQTRLSAYTCGGSIAAESWCTNTGKHRFVYGVDSPSASFDYQIHLPTGDPDPSLDGFADPSLTMCYLTGTENLVTASDVSSIWPNSPMHWWSLYKWLSYGGTHATCIPFQQI